MLALLSLLLVPVSGVLADADTSSHTLARRFSNTRFTNYYAGENTGACGQYHSDSEYVVALPKVNWEGGKYCNKQVRISARGQTATATIVDECEGCPDHALDFSQSLFGHFVGGEQNNFNVGVMTGSWEFVDGSGSSSGGSKNDDDDDDKEEEEKKTTTTTKAKPTTTTTKKTSSSTHATSTLSKATPSPSSSAPASSASASASASAGAADATPTAAQNLKDFNDAMVNLLGLVAQAPFA
ncbi:hypothetical protein MKEN_00593900 [Mycena kentingensis (nom. inval.)]|nr:hypothetical protein MKEN_00593900 [Mycena kentingensis (nom. inval.)]